MKKTLLIFGARPELIKVTPLIDEFKKRSMRDQLLVVHTNQHDSLLEQDLIDFDIRPDYRLNMSRNGSDLTQLIGMLMSRLKTTLSEIEENGNQVKCIISQGDTATTYCSALLAFHAGIPFYHMEAGLRTFDLMDPYPEEFYRRSISMITSFHFAPSQTAHQNLVDERIDPSRILISGNTVIDNLKRHYCTHRNSKRKQALITLHRRNGKAITRHEYIGYFKELVRLNTDWNFLWLTHPGAPLNNDELELFDNIRLVPPVSFLELLRIYEETAIVYTDSGGIQEEAAYLGIPCVIARGKTERVDGVSSGVSALLEQSVLKVDEQIKRFNPKKLVFQNTLYGDGESARRICDQLLELQGE